MIGFMMFPEPVLPRDGVENDLPSDHAAHMGQERVLLEPAGTFLNFCPSPDLPASLDAASPERNWEDTSEAIV